MQPACKRGERTRGKKGEVPGTEQSAVAGRPSAVTVAGQGPGKERPPAAGRADVSMRRPWPHSNQGKEAMRGNQGKEAMRGEDATAEQAKKVQARRDRQQQVGADGSMRRPWPHSNQGKEAMRGHQGREVMRGEDATAEQAKTAGRASRGPAQTTHAQQTLRTRIRQHPRAPDPTVGVGRTMSGRKAQPEISRRHTIRSTRSRRLWRGQVCPRAARGPRDRSRRRQTAHLDHQAFT